MKSRDTRSLPLGAGGSEAKQVMIDYVSDRSAALILSPPRERHPFIGSATAVRIGDCFLLATAAHNFEGITDDSQIRVMPRGAFPHGGLPFVRRSAPVESPDVGWIELAGEVACTSGLRFIQLEDVKCGVRHDAKVAFLIQGFPAAEVSAAEGGLAGVEPLSLGLVTCSVDPESDHLVLEYPPQSSEDRGLELVHPRGMSGGGVWEFPRFESSLVWSPECAKLVAIIRSMVETRYRLFTEPAEDWLRLIADDFPVLRQRIEDKLAVGVGP